MKQYRQFLKEMPSKTIVFAFGRFQCPTTGHELLVKAVKKLASSNSADYIIYASRTQDKKKNPLPVDKKVHYLNLMFPHTNFKAATDTERTFMEVAKELNKKYKNLIMVAGSDRVAAFDKLLNQYNGTDYNYDSIQVISAGERDPDADDASGMSGSKMRELAKDNDYESFKKGLPSSVRDIDGKRLLNDIRLGMGLEAIKEQVVVNVDSLREKYHNKEIFNIGDIVEANNIPFEIVDRGSNYLVLIDESGKTNRKWIQEVTPSTKVIFEDIPVGYAPSEISFKGYTTKNLHHSEDAAKAFQQTIKNSGSADPVSVLNALKATDAYMKINDYHLENGKQPDEEDLKQWQNAHLKAKLSLERTNDFAHHLDYWHMHGHELELMVNKYGLSEEVSNQLSFKGYTTKNFAKLPEVIVAFQKTITNMGEVDPESVLKAIKYTDAYLGTTAEDILEGGKEHADDLLAWSNDHMHAKRCLDKVGEFINHIDYWHSYKDDLDRAMKQVKIITGKESTSGSAKVDESVLVDKNKDKLKVAKVIASILGVDDAEKSSNPEQLVNTALRKSKSLNKDSLKIITKMLKLADEVGINYDKKIIKATSNLTTEQVEMAMQRAEKYGRRYPNVIDNSWVMSEGRVPSIVVDKSKSDNMASLRPDDEKKLVALNNMGKGAVVPVEGITPKIVKDIENYANTGHTDPTTKSHGVEQPEYTHVGASLTTNGDDTLSRMKAKKVRNESVNEEKCCDDKDEDDLEKLSDSELDDMINKHLDDDDFLDAYDEDELHIIDSETGEPVEEHKGIKEEALNEVLSKIERIKARLRFHRNQPKIQRSRQLALKRSSGSSQIAHRARHMAVNVLRKRLLRGQDATKVSTSERERIDRRIEKSRKVIDRMAMKLTSKVKKLEKTRLTHKNFTK